MLAWVDVDLCLADAIVALACKIGGSGEELEQLDAFGHILVDEAYRDGGVPNATQTSVRSLSGRGKGFDVHSSGDRFAGSE